MKTNAELKREIRKDIKALKEELKEAKYWGDQERVDYLEDCIEVQEEELKRTLIKINWLSLQPKGLF